MYIKTHGEKLLLEFLKNDTLLAEYQTLMQNTDDPIHRVKGIRDAVIGWKAKTVCVTIRKDGQELTFRTGSTDLRSRFGSYGSSSIRAEDRQEFERLFGRRANYCAEDITKITRFMRPRLFRRRKWNLSCRWEACKWSTLQRKPCVR